MNADVINRGIRAPQPVARIKAVWLAEMLEETETLPDLMIQYHAESVDEVKQAIGQAGRRLRHAVDRNYTTIDAICEHYLIDRMIFEMPSRHETQVMHRVRSDGESLSANIGRGVLGTTLGGAVLGSTGAGMVGGVSSAGSTSQGFMGRSYPKDPRDDEVRPHLQVLRKSRDARQRVEAILRMGGILNPKVLPEIAIAYKKDDSTEVRDTAERIGKRIYWNAVYLMMERNGTMAEVIEQRARDAGKLDAEAVPAGRDDASPDEIAAMLAKAQNKKKRR